ncbi:MAG: hypothetical protein PHU54_08460 [Candidatus Omnitrophica bacterium]|jgi:hypothetical protein|nr:hypothetical protein [Candidatus Omnitrophota bacterium]
MKISAEFSDSLTLIGATLKSEQRDDKCILAALHKGHAFIDRLQEQDGEIALHLVMEYPVKYKP